MIPIKSVTITTQGAIPLGRQGEHHAREIVFPQPDGLLDETWTCFHRRARDREAYPVPLEKRDGNLVWLVTSGDTGIPGNGQAELTCTDGSGAVLKTKVYGTSVEKALQDGGEVPDPVKPWYDAILKAIEEAQQGADGGYYTPIIQQLTESTMTVAFQPSQPDMPEQAPVTVNLPVGPRGPRGIAGPTSPYNILDNSDFRNPVNQRGGAGYPSGSYRYTLDRWYASKYIGVGISDGGITISGEGSGDSYYGFSQRIPYEKAPKSGETFTFVLYCADGTNGIFSGVAPATGGTTKIGQGGTVIANVYAELSFANDGYAQLSIYVKNGKTLGITRTALYEGTYTAETLPEYQPKGYGTELAECQRYYQIRSTGDVSAADMRPTMRLSSPTVTTASGGYRYSADF